MRTGYHAVYPSDFYAGIDDAYINGFDFVQFDLGVPRFFLDNLTNDELKRIRDYARDKNIEITFHSPGDNVSLFCDYPLIRKGIIDEFMFILEKADFLNARHMTFHAGVYPKFKKSGCKTDNNSYTDYYAEVFYDNLKTLTDNCGNVLVCMENLDLDDIKRKVIMRFFDERQPIYLTLDTAKMYSRNNELKKQDFDFFIEHKNRIREMHIHDLNKEYGGHQIVGNGFIDFSIFKQFVNNDVYLNFEVRPIEAAKKSKNAIDMIWNF